MNASSRPTDSEATGVWCCELELSGEQPVRAVAPRLPQHTLARVLVRLHGEPLGYVTLPTHGADIGRDDASSVAREALEDRIAAHLALDGLAVPATDLAFPQAGSNCPSHLEAEEFVSVVVCTRNRSEILSRCVTALAAVTYAELEVIIVDNAPVDTSTRDIVAEAARSDPRFRYAVEPRPGLSCARNRGLAEATGTILAYTDDDVLVDPEWVTGLVRGFRRRADVACVTGMVCTAGVDGPIEAYFDSRAAAWSSRFDHRLYDMGDNRDGGGLYPYSPAAFGTGANFAFDRKFLLATNGFDEALGAGARTRGGEDIDKFVDTLRHGGAISYEPSAVVWHRHRSDRDGLLRQMFGYGTGLTAFLAKYVAQPATRWEVLKRMPKGLNRAVQIHSDATTAPEARITPPRGARLMEVAGYAAGPFLYARARWEGRSLP